MILGERKLFLLYVVVWVRSNCMTDWVVAMS
jgi:hypothetical protein